MEPGDCEMGPVPVTVTEKLQVPALGMVHVVAVSIFEPALIWVSVSAARGSPQAWSAPVEGLMRLGERWTDSTVSGGKTAERMGPATHGDSVKPLQSPAS